MDAAWARYVRPFALVAWLLLTLGLVGSKSDYYTLGWGRCWFWDPVENASLMPWLAGTAFIRFGGGDGEARRAEGVRTIFLAILVFSLSLLGTFLVRWGVLASVHAFAGGGGGACSSSSFSPGTPARSPCSPGARRC